VPLGQDTKTVITGICTKWLKNSQQNFSSSPLLILFQAYSSQQPWGKPLSMPASCNYQQQAPQVKQQPAPGKAANCPHGARHHERVSACWCLSAVPSAQTSLTQTSFPSFSQLQLQLLVSLHCGKSCKCQTASHRAALGVSGSRLRVRSDSLCCASPPSGTGTPSGRASRTLHDSHCPAQDRLFSSGDLKGDPRSTANASPLSGKGSYNSDTVRAP